MKALSNHWTAGTLTIKKKKLFVWSVSVFTKFRYSLRMSLPGGPKSPSAETEHQTRSYPSLEVLPFLMLSPRCSVTAASFTSSEDSDINRDAGAGSRALTSKPEANWGRHPLPSSPQTEPWLSGGEGPSSPDLGGQPVLRGLPGV